MANMGLSENKALILSETPPRFIWVVTSSSSSPRLWKITLKLYFQSAVVGRTGTWGTASVVFGPSCTAHDEDCEVLLMDVWRQFSNHEVRLMDVWRQCSNHEASKDVEVAESQEAKSSGNFWKFLSESGEDTLD
eukprot:s5431_g2.t1